MPSELFYLKSLNSYISNRRGVSLIFYAYHVLQKLHSANPDQTPRFATSDKGMH